ncbi:MAG: phosphoribosylamine--glycine ligase [Bacteroidota bacterium]
MSQHNILIIGSGGREHALAWKLSQSPLPKKLFIAPGNAGTALLGENIDLNDTDFEKIKEVVLDKNINLVVVGPEIPLVKGIHDFFLNDPLLKAVPVIGPVAAAAQLEGSKDFAKQFMLKYQIPTAAFQSFTRKNLAEGFNFLETLKAPYVLKADGLAAGKGVLICATLDDAKNELKEMLENSMFGEASHTVVIEEFLSGIEMSAFILTDGINYVMLPEAKDYKRIGDGDTGLNTGGMGTVSPVPFADVSFMTKIEDRIIKPTLEGLKSEGIPYTGFIFFGIMKVNEDPMVIEYNARLGDPETEVILPRIKNDLLELFLATAEKKLHNFKIEIDPRITTCVMAVAPGYPESYPKGMEIKGLQEFTDGMIFHSGTKNDPESNKVRTNGGRVLAITSYGTDLPEAMKNTYLLAQSVHFEGMYYRKDIGMDLLSY